MRKPSRWATLAILLCASCVNKKCSELDGPVVVVGNRENQILSPFPADRLTLADPTTPTGLRVDLPPPKNGNELERLLIEKANRLDGFGVFSPICVRFDRPLDLASIGPAAARLVCVEDGSQVPLDLGDGLYPVDTTRDIRLFEGETPTPSLVLPPDNRVPWYEDSTNTLILRPLEPLKPASRYVAMLTRYLRGLNGAPIEPPPNEPPTQAEFRDFTAVMTHLGIAPIEVGFYWTFTTHSVTTELEAVRAGLDGEGPLAWLPQQIPPRVTSVRDLQRGLLDGNPYTLDAPIVAGLFKLLYQIAKIVQPVYPELESDLRAWPPFFGEMGNVDYFYFGTIRSADFLASAARDFRIDLASGAAEVAASSVPFMISVPKPTAENGFAQPPYPVIVLGHGLTGSRIMVMPLADRLAARGFAVACIDLVGHGPIEALYALPAKLKTLSGPITWLLRPVLLTLGWLLGVDAGIFDSWPVLVDKVFGDSVLAPIFWEGCAQDVDGDGRLDPNVGFFHSDFFRMRDSIRQCVVDQMCFVRALRNLGQDLNGNGRLDPEEGDVDGDGALDLGGPVAPISYAGVSLGAILGGVFMGVDPAVTTGVLNVGGGGLADIVFRTTELRASFIRHVIRDVFGLAVVGRPSGGGVALSFNDDTAAFATAPAVAGEVEVRNLTKGLSRVATAGPDGAFAVTVTADVGDALEVRAGGLTFPATAPYAGLGVARGSSRAREYFMLLEWFLEPADPAAYAPHWWRRPLAGVPQKNVLLQLSCGDPTVPISAGVALARAAGLVSTERMAAIRELGVLEGAIVPVDVLLPVESSQYRAVRFHTAGKHAYVIGDNKNDLDASILYGKAAQTQIGVFCATGGAVVYEDPIFEVVIPDGN